MKKPMLLMLIVCANTVFAKTGIATARVDQHAATFWFPVENADRTWIWGEGFPGQRNYAWLVKASLMGQKYEFGYTKWNPPAGREWPGQKGEGRLQELLRAGQANLWEEGRLVKGAYDISVFREGESVVVQLTEPEFLMAFQKERPKQVVFETVGVALKQTGKAVEISYASLPPADAAASSTREDLSKRILAIVRNNEMIEKEEAIALLEKAGGRHSEIKMRDGTKVMINLPGTRFAGDEIPAIASQIPGVRILAMGNTSRITDAGLGFIKNMSDLEILTVTGREISDAGVAQLCRLPSLQSLQLNYTAITDAGLKQISRMKSLKKLTIMRSGRITDKGLAHLSRMKNLEQLSLFFVPVTDAGLAYLADTKHLQVLWVSHAAVSDVGLARLEKLQGLKGLFLVNTQVTPRAAKRLKKKRPEVILPQTLTAPCEGYRQVLANVKSRWAQTTGKEDGYQPGQADLMPFFDDKFTGDFNSVRCEDGGKISINPMGEPPGCSIHGTK